MSRTCAYSYCKILLILLLAIPLYQCKPTHLATTTLNHQLDGPPQDLTILNLDTIADAKPRIEPKSRYGNKSTYSVHGKTYHVLPSADNYHAWGLASWYGSKFHGRLTSNREPYDMLSMTAAHRELPIPCYVRVRNVSNNKTVIVRVNDRGPFHDDRIIDLSYAAATKLGITNQGTAKVEVQTVSPQNTQPETLHHAQHRLSTRLVALQFGVFSNAEQALSHSQRITHKTHLPTHILVAKTAHQTLHMVVSDSFPSEQVARSTLAAIRKQNISAQLRWQPTPLAHHDPHTLSHLDRP